MSARVVEGLKLVVEAREKCVRSSLHVTDRVLKSDVYVWRKGEDLASQAEAFANNILAAVGEYRAAVEELEREQQRAGIAEERP